MAKQARLDVLGAQRLAQQRIVHQINLSDGQVVGSAPVGVDELELMGRELRRHGGTSGDAAGRYRRDTHRTHRDRKISEEFYSRSRRVGRDSRVTTMNAA